MIRSDAGMPTARFCRLIGVPERTWRHVRTRVRTPGQDGSREGSFGSLKYEKLLLEEIPDALDLVCHAEDYRLKYNAVHPHETLSWNRPHDVNTGQIDPCVLTELRNVPVT
ncbi:integrase core domain-containing protein [Streptomyces sp. NPDC059718]